MISVLVPYGYGGPERAAAWKWLEQRWRAILPDAELIVESGAEDGDPGRFDKGAAVNRAAARASGETFAIADADTAPDPGVAEAFGWGTTVFPARYFALDAAVTRHVFRHDPSVNLSRFDAPVLETSVGGIVVTPRECFELVGGLDERAKGWGGIDAIYAHAVGTLWLEPYTRFGSCWHLWHPRPAEHHWKAPYFNETNALLQRYSEVAGDPEAMRALIAEGKLVV